MRSTDQRMILQGMLRTQYGNILSTVNQYDGLYYGFIIDTDSTNPSLGGGYARVGIPAINSDPWGPCPYPSINAPSAGTTCVVGFDPSKNEPVIISYIGANPDFTEGGTPGYFGSYYSYTTQNVTSTTAVYIMPLDLLDAQNGFSVVGGNKVTAAYTGEYSFTWSGQFQNTDTQLQDVEVWLRKNGVDVPGSNGKISVPNSHGGTPGHGISGWNYFLSLNAGDYIQLCWQASSTSVSLQYYGVGTNPTRPETASVIATIAQVAYRITGGAAGVQSVTAGDATIVIGGTSSDPTVKVGTVPYAQVSGTPSSLPPSGPAGGDLVGSTYPNPVVISASTTQAGKVQLTDSTSTTSSSLAATATAVKSAYDLAYAAVPNTRTVSTTAPLTGGGALSSNLTLAVNAASTTSSGVVQLTDSVSTTSSTLAATATAVSTVNTTANSKVASVTAADATITIGGTATAPTVRVGSVNYAISPGRLLVYGHSYANGTNDAFETGNGIGTSTVTRQWTGLLRNAFGFGMENTQVLAVPVPAVATASSVNTQLGILPEEAFIEYVGFLPSGTWTGVATNYRRYTLSIYNVWLGTQFKIANANISSGVTVSTGNMYNLMTFFGVQSGFQGFGVPVPQLAFRSDTNAYTMSGPIVPGLAALTWESTAVGTGAADPGGIVYVRYGTRYRNNAVNGARVAWSGVYHGGWATAFAFRPRSQSYYPAFNSNWVGVAGEVNVSATANVGATTISCDSLGSAIASGTTIVFSIGNTSTASATLSAGANAGATSLTVNALTTQIPAGATGFPKNATGGYDTLTSNGMTVLNWGINDAGDATYDSNSYMEAMRAVIANASCAYVSGATQSNIQYVAGNGAGATWANHTQPAGGQFWNPSTQTAINAPSGSVKMFSGAVGATPPTIKINIPAAFEGGTVDLFFLALNGANNGGAATITVDGANPPSGACTINTNNASATGNIFTTTCSISGTTLTATTGSFSNPGDLGKFITGTGITAGTYISTFSGEPLTPTAFPTVATMSASGTTGTGITVTKLGFVPMVKRLTNLAAGAHTITITLTSMGAGNVPRFFFYGYGIEPSNTLSPDLSVPVAVMNTARITNPSIYAQGATTNTNATALNGILSGILAGTATSSQSGNSTEPALNTQAFIVDIDTAINQNSVNFSNDGLHLNSRGNAIIANLVLTTMLSTSGVTPVNLMMTSG